MQHRLKCHTLCNQMQSIENYKLEILKIDSAHGVKENTINAMAIACIEN